MSKMLDDLQTESEISWGSSYKHFPTVLMAHGLKTGVELGVAFGGHAEAILNQAGVSKLYGVDSYRHRSEYDDPMNWSQSDLDRLYERMVQRLSPFGTRFTAIRKDSDQAVIDIPGAIDFVYIDADHSYRSVLNDLCRWVPKVRTGGIVGGHDYGHVNFPGVRNAVDEFFRRFGWQIHLEGDGVWWVRTQPISISYIMPAYNCENTVAEAVQSILAGNWEDTDELLIVDDGSTDGTPQILQELGARSARVTILTHLRNKGGGAARNSAVEHAKHPLIFCLDADNLLVPGSVRSLLDFFIRCGADAAAFEEIHYFTNSPQKITHKWRFTSTMSLAEYLADFKVPGSSGNYLFAKESWARAGGYPEFAGAMDTWGFGFRQVATGSRIAVQPGSFYLHRHGYDSYWVRQERLGNTNLLALQVMMPFLEMIDDRDVDYILSRRERSRWLGNLPYRPLRVKCARPRNRIFAAPWPARLALSRLKRLAKRALQSLARRWRDYQSQSL